MRVLTVRQPWAWAIIHGGKDVENRSRNIAGAYRGPVAIHVGMAVDGIDYDDPMYGLVYRPCPHSNEPRHNQYWCDWCKRVDRQQAGDRGHIIGVVDLVDVHIGATYNDDACYRAPAPGEPAVIPMSRCSPWAMQDHHHLVLDNPRALATPIPAKGRLGLWKPDDGLLWAIRAQIGTPALATNGEEVTS